tara:strand:- start:427 stop:612 length:186 start_codon:yes stop_codon:yes gene_type:complete
MSKMTVEMTDDEVRAAIVQWASKTHGMTIDPVKVSITSIEEWRGHGTMEEKYHRPVVKFET